MWGLGVGGLMCEPPTISLSSHLACFPPQCPSFSPPPAPPPTPAGARQAAPHLSASGCSSCPRADPHPSLNQAPWWRRGQTAPQRRAGCPGHPAPRAWAAGTSYAIARSVRAPWAGEVGRGKGRGIQGLILTLLLSLAEDAELVQRKCWAGGGRACWRGEREGDRCRARSPRLQPSRNWVLGSADLGSYPVLLLTSCVSLSELLNFSGPVS